MNYIYKITCLANGRMYIGQRSWSGDPMEDKYFGSSANPAFYADLELYGKEGNFVKEILEEVEDRMLLDERESYWISQYYDNDVLCYNLSKGGGACRCDDYCKRTNKGIYGIPHDKRVESGKKAAAILKEKGLGLYAITPEQRSANAKYAAEINRQKGTSICFDKELRKITNEKSNETNKRNKTGIYSAESKKKADEIHRQNGTAIYSLTHEQRVEYGKKGGSLGGKRGSATCRKLGKGFCFDKEIQKKAGKLGGTVSAAHKRENGEGFYDPELQKRATATRNRKFNYYYNGELVYAGRACSAKNKMNRLGQVWVQGEEVVE